MNRHALPIASLVLLLTLAFLVSAPSLSFAASAGADSGDSGNSFDIDDKKNGNDGDKASTDDVLEAIFTLGGLLDFNGADGSKGKGSKSDLEDADLPIDLIQDGPKLKLPPIDKKIGKGGPVLTSPVPEPTAALLFGVGILVVATQRPRDR